MVAHAFSMWPQVCWTISPTSEFKNNSFHKILSNEGVPLSFVTSNDAEFPAEPLNDLWKTLGSRHLHTAFHDSQCNGSAEDFVHFLKSVI